jgi:two-component system, NarL family, response regulator DegU
MSYADNVTVLVVDDHATTRKYITILLEENRAQVVGEGADGHEAVQLCAQLRPQIIVLDVSMPLLNGFEAARQIAEVSPATKVIFLTSHGTKEFVAEALRVGGAGFVSKEHAATDLPAAIEAVLQGKTYIDGKSAA